jgi:hypothetical protein
MSKLALGGFLVSALIGTACNGDSASPGNMTPANPFEGKWACSEELSLTFTSPPGAAVQTSIEMSILRITAAGNVLTAIKETEGGSNCQVSFTSDGSTGTLSEGQTCTTGKGLSIAYKSGSATVNGSSMSSTFSFEATGNLDVDGGTVPAMASGTQNSTCSRLSSPPPPGGGGATTGGW